MKKIALAADHAGYLMKNYLVKYLTEKGFECTDLGTDSPESVDYPLYAKKLCEKVLDGSCDCGILICGTGIGMSIAANRNRGIRAALCPDAQMAALSREHNNANVLCLGARTTGTEAAKNITDTFLDTDFLGGRHEKRVKMLDE